jgi:protein involved in polysaccharide export with SLBB domain
VRQLTRLTATLALILGATAPSVAQDRPSDADSLLIRLSSAQRASVTRAQLEAALVEIDVILNSSGYSAAIKDQKRMEAELIRRRLTEGDIRPGDVILLAVANEPSLSNAFPVTTSRSIVIPAAGEIPIGNLLRSEVEPYLTEQMKRFVRDPLVRAEPQIRIAIFGGVGQQGFFLAPASALLTDVIMQSAGGVTGNVKLDKSSIKRAGREIVDRDAFQAALRNGLSLDQLNIQAGDEIHVGQRRAGALPIVAALSAVAGITWSLQRLGVF